MARQNSKTHLTGFIILTLSLLFTYTPLATAHSDADGMSKEKLHVLTKEAELVFRGQVTAINYTTAKSQIDRHLRPYTLVTYQIENVYKGDHELTEVTLRFLGGAALDENGEIAGHLQVELFPLFDIGDRDILFVRGNTRSICPLVDCADGRLRLIDDGVYTEGGVEIVRDEEDEISAGDFFELAEINTHDILGKTVTTISKDPTSIKPGQNISRYDVFSLAGAQPITHQSDTDHDDLTSEDSIDENILENLIIETLEKTP
jgi:hypothetical protein